MRKALAEVIETRVHDAAGKGKYLTPPQGSEGVKFIDDAVLSALSHHAAIKHNDFRLISFRARLAAYLLQIAGNALRVSLIHLTSDGPDIHLIQGYLAFLSDGVRLKKFEQISLKIGSAGGKDDFKFF